jgi:hypothetical protein
VKAYAKDWLRRWELINKCKIVLSKESPYNA